LWNFDNLFDNSGDNNDSFDDLLYLNDLWNLNHLFNDLVNVDSNFFDSFHCPWNFDNLFDNNLDWVVLSDVMVYWLLDFDDLVDLNDSVDKFLNFNDFYNLNSFNDDLGNGFWNSDNSFNNDWNFNSSINNLFNFFDQGSRVINNLLDFFDSVLVDNLFPNDFNDLNSGYLNLDLNDLFDSLWNFNNLFNDLNDRNWLFDSDLNNFWNRFNVVNNFSSVSVFD
jgi:hypothetical protein